MNSSKAIAQICFLGAVLRLYDFGKYTMAPHEVPLMLFPVVCIKQANSLPTTTLSGMTLSNPWLEDF